MSPYLNLISPENMIAVLETPLPVHALERNNQNAGLRALPENLRQGVCFTEFCEEIIPRTLFDVTKEMDSYFSEVVIGKQHHRRNELTTRVQVCGGNRSKLYIFASNQQ